MKITLVTLSIWILAAFISSWPGHAVTEAAVGLPSPTPKAQVAEAAKEYLLDSAAADFVEHQPPFPARFRRVRLGHVGDARKETSYRLCGQFLPTPAAGQPQEPWTAFTTVRTSGYEQYLGSGTTYCTDPKIVWDSGDLSLVLKERLNAKAQKK